jgi:hypothetical protein
LKYFVLFLVLAIYVSCSLTEDASEKDGVLNLKISLESIQNQESTAKVFLQGADGDQVTGSTVIIVNNQGVVNLLPFSFNQGCYSGDIPLSTDGEYTIMVDSLLVQEPLMQEVQHPILTDSPDILVLENPLGESALQGETLLLEQGLQIGWSAVENATVYQVALYYQGTICHIGSVSGTALTLTADDLSGAGMFSCCVKAQYIGGDGLLLSENYYSYSEASGPSIVFYME